MRAWPAVFRVAMAGMVAYRAEMVIWVLSATLPMVMLALWNAASASGPIAGLSQGDFSRYFAVTLIVRQLTGSWVVWELNYTIRQGELSPKLLRPLNPLVWNLAETGAAMPFRIVVLAPILGVMCWWRSEIAFWPGLGVSLAFVFSVLLAFIASWTIQALFGMLAFWFEQSMGFFQAYFVIWSVLSGYVVPMPMMPAGFHTVARALPFYATLGAPIDIALGIVDPVSAISSQVVWVVVLVAMASAMWRAGIRRYGAVGA